MSPSNWNEIESIFDLAIDLPASERQRLLSERCAGQPEVRAEVEKLLQNADLAESFMESPVWTDTGFLDSSVKKVISNSFEETPTDGPDLAGLVLGPYRLVSEIGRGGMGTVYRAERVDGEFSQEVAIKLLKRGLDSDFIIKRFRHERQILASFEHPFISRLLDGGTTPSGVPYFVMEYIRDGVTIYDWCDSRKLNLWARLKLFLKVCSALEYAHERKIVHRDIKPSNILINRSGAPKLLDFGIAKILDPDLIHESFNPTASVVRMMTPDYASPEQVRGLEITPSSDVYSLGILLYELLCGHKPYSFDGRAYHELSEVICEAKPTPLTQTLSARETRLNRYRSDAELYETRGSKKDDLISIFAAGLDPIVLKALAKEPIDRYAGVEELSAVISRFNREFLLVPPSAAGSNEPVTTVSSDVKSVAVLPFRTILFGSGHDTDETFLGLGLADSIISRLSRIHKFLVVPASSTLSFADGKTNPINAGRQLKVDYILDGSIKVASDRLRLSVQLLDVEENATVWATSIDEKVGEVFALEEALSNQLIEALVPRLGGRDLARYLHRGTDSPEAFENYLRGRYHFNSMSEDRFAKAFVLFHQAIAADPDYAYAYCGIANYYNWLGLIGVLPPSECVAPALEAGKRAVELDPELSEAHASLGFSLYTGAFQWKDAEYHLRQATELNPNNANAFLWYSVYLFTTGQFDLGFEYAHKAVTLDPLTPYSHYNIGSGLYYSRRFEEAERQHKKVVDEFPEYGLGYYGLSKIHRYLGKTKLAIEENDRAFELMGGSTLTQISRAECLAADGQKEAAFDQLAELDELATKRFVSPYMLAMVYSFLADDDKVLDLLEASTRAGEPWLCCAPVEARFGPVFGTKRFQDVLRSIDHPLRDIKADHTRGFTDLTTILIDAASQD